MVLVLLDDWNLLQNGSHILRRFREILLWMKHIHPLIGCLFSNLLLVCYKSLIRILVLLATVTFASEKVALLEL
jgi:hypothetical protein